MSKAMKSISAALFAMTLCWHTSASSESLAQVVRRTLRTNPEVLSTRANERAARHVIDQAKSSYYPTVDLNLAYGKEKSQLPSRAGYATFARTEKRLTVSQMIFDGWNTKNQVSSAQMNSQAAYYQTLDQDQLTGLDAITAYLNVIRFRHLYHLSVQNRQTHYHLEQKVKLKYEQGAGNKADLELAMSRLFLARSLVSQVASSKANARATFYKTVGTMPGRLSIPHPTMRYMPKTLARALEMGLHANPRIHVVGLQSLASDYDIKVAYSGYYPQFSLDLRRSKNNNLDGVAGPNNDMQGMVTMRYNLFRGGADKASIYSTRERANAVHYNEEITLRDIRESITVTWNDLKASRIRYVQQRNRVASAGEVVVAYQKQFALGKRSLLNLLDTERELFNAKNDLTNARFDLLVDIYRMYSTLGIMLPVVFNTTPDVDYAKDYVTPQNSLCEVPVAVDAKGHIVPKEKGTKMICPSATMPFNALANHMVRHLRTERTHW